MKLSCEILEVYRRITSHKAPRPWRHACQPTSLEYHLILPLGRSPVKQPVTKHDTEIRKQVSSSSKLHTIFTNISGGIYEFSRLLSSLPVSGENLRGRLPREFGIGTLEQIVPRRFPKKYAPNSLKDAILSEECILIWGTGEGAPRSLSWWQGTPSPHHM